MILTLTQLASACGASVVRAQLLLPHVQEAIDAYSIDTPQRIAAFLANVGHESGGLRYLSELWGPTAQQARYERDFDQPWPEDAAQAQLPEFHRNALAWQLGNTEPGDGSKMRGHGLLQNTGRFNHARVRDRLRAKFPELQVPDFEEHPDQLAEYRWAALAAGDYWDEHNINRYADADDFDGCCDVINRGRKTRAIGDTNGYADRCARWETAKAVLA